MGGCFIGDYSRIVGDTSPIDNPRNADYALIWFPFVRDKLAP